MHFLQGARAFRIFLCFACAYLLSYALRSINAVVGPVLVQELGLSNTDLGLLSSAYFVSFACLQLPLGVWLDKYGARRVEAALLLFAVFGCVLFASGNSLPILWLGRALIGIGVSACLMAAYKAYRQWYPLTMQSGLASAMLVAGTSGALCATVPAHAALPILGWRGLFWLCAVLLLLVAALIFFGLRQVERKFAAPVQNTESFMQSLRGYLPIFADPYFRRFGALGLINQGTFVALQTLWAGPWLREVLGLSDAASSQVLFILNLLLLLGYLALAWCAPRYIKSGRDKGWAVEWVLGLGVGAALLVQLAMLCWSSRLAWVLWPLLAVCVTCIALAQTHVSLSFPAELAGRANAAYNLLFFVGAFVAQSGMGGLIDFFAALEMAPAVALRATLAVMLAMQSLAWLYFVCSKARPGLHTVP